MNRGTKKFERHRNEIKSDNAPTNLKICDSIKRHRHEHHPLTRVRKPGERNPMILCRCGCGRVFIHGHNNANYTASNEAGEAEPCE